MARRGDAADGPETSAPRSAHDEATPPGDGDGDPTGPSGVVSGRLAGVPYRWVAMGVVMLGTFMVVLDTTVVNIGLPSMQRDFGTVEGVEWVVTVYLASVAVTQMASGWCADRFGRRACFIVALVLFTAASVLCAASVDLGMLVAARGLQGVGGGLLLPVAMAMIYELFEPHERGRALGYFGLVIMAAPAVGPVLGGALTSSVGWRWLFLINLPIGVVGVPVALRLLRDTGFRERRRFDVVGLVLAAGGVVLVLVGLERSIADGWRAPVFALLAAGVVVLGTYVWHAGRVSEPLADLRILATPVFAVAMVTVALMTVAQYSRLVYVPLELGTLRDISELQIGFTMLPSAIGIAITTPIGGRLADRIGARVPVTIGLAVMAASFWGLAQLTVTTSLPVVSALLFVGGLGAGLSMMAPNIVAMNSVRASQVSQASGLSNVSRQMAAAMGTAVVTTIFAASRPDAGAGAVSPADAVGPYRTVFLVGLGLLVVAVAVAQFLPGRVRALELQRERVDEAATAAHHTAEAA